MEHWNRSSYAKVMAILQTDSELEDKTIRKWKKFAAVARNWWKRWGKRQELDSNKTYPATRPQPGHKLKTVDSKTEICAAMARKGCRTGKRYGTGLMARTQEHLKQSVDVNLMVYLKLWLPFDENKGDLIFRKVLVTLDLVETRHKSIRLPNNTIRNPTIFFIFLFFF